MASIPISKFSLPAVYGIPASNNLSLEISRALHALAVRRNYEPYRAFLKDPIMDDVWWDTCKDSSSNGNVLCLVCCDYVSWNNKEAHGLDHLREHKLLAFL